VAGDLLNNASGSIHSIQGTGLDLDSASALKSINNQGLISSDSTSILNPAVNLAGQVLGDITNSGNMVANTGPAFIMSGTSGGALNNTGTILSTGAPAVIVQSTANLADGIVNNGLIRTVTGLTAVDLSSVTKSTPLTNNMNGVIKGDVLLSQVANELDSVLQMNGGSITGGVIALGGNKARALNIVNGTISQGITLSNNPDVINQWGGSIGNISGVANTGQTLNIQGLVNTAGNITNVDNLKIASGGQLTINDSISGIKNIVLKENPLDLPDVVDNLNFIPSAGTVIETELKDVNNFGHMVLAGPTNTLNNAIVKISLADNSIIHPADEFVVLNSLLNPITGTVSLIQPNSEFVNFIIKEATSGGILNNQLLTLVAQLVYQAPSQFPLLGEILLSLPLIGNIELKNLLAQLNLLTQQQITQALSSLTPVVNGGGPRLAQNMMAKIFDSIADRTYSSGRIMMPIPAGDEDYMHRGIWTRVIGTTARQGALDDFAGYHARSGGVIVGYDGCYNHCSMFGGALSYSFGDVNTDLDFNQQQTLQGYQFTGYFIHDYGPCRAAYIDLMGAVAYDKFSNTRDIVAGSAHSIAHGSFDGWQYGVNLESGYRFAYGQCEQYQIVPLVKIRYSNLNLNDYTETGSGLGLIVDNNNMEEFITGAGFKLRCISKNLVPELRFNILYDWIADIQTASSTFIAGGIPFVSNGLEVPHWTYNLGISLGGYTKNNWLVSLDYDLDLKTEYIGHAGSVKVKYEW